MGVIDYFWQWMIQTVSNGLSILNRFTSNQHTAPFLQLALVIVAIGAVVKYILWPIIAPGSDKAKRKKEEEE